MRNYIILNNKNSNTISGLIIQELAPISKPLQRTQVETIDGRDGDIVTPLGYAAYNKKIKIGLYGNFNINDIIAYFATKGTAIFSNEPDKYYYYQIVDQIDYERLVRYRVANVTMHVQPFKYSATEGTITVDSSDTVSDEGSDIALDGTAEAPFNVLRHKGNATQKTVAGINLLAPPDDFSRTINGVAVKCQNGIWTFNGTSSANGSTGILPVENYTIKEGDYWHYDNTVVSSQINVAMHFTDGTSGAFSMNTQNRIVPLSDVVGKTIDGVHANFTGGYTFNGIASPMILHNVSTHTDFEPYVGGIPSPNPDYPQDIQVVMGDSTVKIIGKNLITLDGKDIRGGEALSVVDRGANNLKVEATASVGSYSSRYVEYALSELGLQVGDTFTVSMDITGAYIGANGASMRLYWNNNTSSIIGVLESDSQPLTLTIPSGTTSIVMYFYVRRASAPAVGSTASFTNIQLERGSSASPFESYKEQSYVIPFGDTYLAKIGDYADEPVNVDGTWYIRRNVGKQVYDGSNDESWEAQNSKATSTYFQASGIILRPTAVSDIPMALCDNFIGYKGQVLYSADYYGFAMSASGYLRVNMLNSVASDAATFKSWLASHNITVYYALVTPTDEAITDQDLIDALDALYDQAHSYKGHTHITATAADGNAPAVLAVDVNEDNESTVTNAGNTTSRPILTIYGQGDIGVYINDVEVLDVALGDEEYITLDSVEMEAYKDTTANLKNRLVTGDYSKLALNAGDNKIRFTGTVTKYEISKYSRWL